MNLKPNWMINVDDFFDPHNIEHIQAYKHLQETGMWPIDFAIKLSGYNFTQMWQVSIANKMADAWVEAKLKEAQKWPKNLTQSPGNP